MAEDAPCYHAGALCNAALIETSILPCQYTTATLQNTSTNRPALDWQRKKKSLPPGVKVTFSVTLPGLFNLLILTLHLLSVCIQLVVLKEACMGKKEKRKKGEILLSSISTVAKFLMN